MKLTKKDTAILSIGVIFILAINYYFATHTRKPLKLDADDPKILLQLNVNNDDFIIGENNAPIKMVFYGDFACHHCIRFVKENFEKIREKYIIPGKVQFIFRPLISTKATIFGAQFLFCEKRISDLNAEIFYNMFKDNWVFKSDYGNELLKLVRKEHWVSEEKFIKCVSSNKLKNLIINKHKHTIKDLNITSTPAIFINNEYVKADNGVFYHLNKIYKELNVNKQ